MAAILGASPTAAARRLPSYSTAPPDAAAAVAEGFGAIKLSIGNYSVLTEREEIVELVRSTREAIGPDVRHSPPTQPTPPSLLRHECTPCLRTRPMPDRAALLT